MDNPEPDDQLLGQTPFLGGGLPPLPIYLRPGARELAVAYRQHTGVGVERIEVRIFDEEGTIKDLNFPTPETR